MAALASALASAGQGALVQTMELAQALDAALAPQQQPQQAASGTGGGQSS